MLRNWRKQFHIGPKPRPVQLFLYFFGLTVLNLGVVLTVHSGAGASGFDALIFALSNIFQIRLAYVVYIVSFLCVLATATIRRSYPRMTTFVTSLVSGAIVDVWQMLLRDVHAVNLWTSVLMLLAGTCLLSFGIGIYLLSRLPAGPIDDLVVALHEKKLSLRAAKLSVDLSCLTLAFFLGGTVGWGSLLLNFALGPLVQFWNKRGAILVSQKIKPV